MKKEIYKGILISISFSFTTLMTFISYAAWTNILTKTDGTTINATIWNEVVNKINDAGTRVDSLESAVSGISNIPIGAVMAFNGLTCPSGWTAADGSGDEKNTSGVNTTLDLRGTFVRGLNGDQNTRDVVRALGNYQTDDFKSHTHNYYSLLNENGGYSAQVTNSYVYGRYTGVGAHATTAVGGTETRPKNIVLLYCVKN